MNVSQRRTAVLVGILVILVLVLVWQQSSPGPSSTTAAGNRSAPQVTALPAVDPLKLADLAEHRPGPAGAGRNPFRLGAAPAAGRDPDEAPPAPRPAPPVTPVQAPTGPPPPPPIPLKFIGLVVASEQVGRIAVLSDDRGVYHGRQGELVEGRYRIVRIGEESIEIEYADGRGRQTIRLSGS